MLLRSSGLSSPAVIEHLADLSIAEGLLRAIGHERASQTQQRGCSACECLKCVVSVCCMDARVHLVCLAALEA